MHEERLASDSGGRAAGYGRRLVFSKGKEKSTAAFRAENKENGTPDLRFKLGYKDHLKKLDSIGVEVVKYVKYTSRSLFFLSIRVRGKGFGCETRKDD